MIDVTLYACGKNSDFVSNKLELETNTAIKRLKDNSCYLLTHQSFNLCFFFKVLKYGEKHCFFFVFFLMEKPLNHQIHLKQLELC